MEADSQSVTQESMETAQINSGVVGHSTDEPEPQCALCRRIFSPENEVNGLETLNICVNCKFMFFEDLETTIRDSRWRRPFRGRRGRPSSSESIEDAFSHQFSHLINLVRQSQQIATVSAFENGTQLLDGERAARVLHHTSSHTTPSGSRRWRRSSLSGNESEGINNLDSVFGDSESNVSFSGFGVFHGESDSGSFSAYGEESDASMGGHNFLDSEIPIQPDDGSDIDSDTDIDPMHAGLNQWNSDDQDDEDGEWEEVNAEENIVETTEAEGWIQGAFNRSHGENNGPLDWLRGLHSPENEGIIRWRARESRRAYFPNTFTNLEETVVPPYIGNSGDYLGARGFDQLLEQLAETDNSRRGAPPAALSFVENLPCVIISEEHERHGGLVCAVCKDPLSIGTKVNQLPCTHLYHPYCILPWLRSRNSCPLCRYELPTDDKDYEEGKRNAITRVEIQEIQQEDPSEYSSADTSDESEADEDNEFSNARTAAGQGEFVNEDCAIGSSGRESERRGWFFLAAAPIVSLVGIVLVLWFRAPLVERRRSRGYFRQQRQQQQVHIASGSSNRRWWSLF